MRICLSIILLIFAIDIALAKDLNKLCYENIAKGQYDKAMPHCTDALNSGGDSVSLALTYNNRGRIFFERGQYDLAIADYSKALVLDFNDNYIAALLYYGRGSAYQAINQFEQAIDDYNKVIALIPRYYKAYNYLGNIYSLKGQDELAIALYSKAIELAPQEAILVYNRGISRARMSKYDEAEEDFKRVLDISPTSSNAMYNMACLFALRDNIDEACKWLNDSIKSGYNNWDYIRQDNTLDNIRNASCYKGIMLAK